MPPLSIHLVPFIIKPMARRSQVPRRNGLLRMLRLGSSALELYSPFRLQLRLLAPSGAFTVAVSAASHQ